jgi:hypothetical protein
MSIDPLAYDLDLASIARKVVQRIDRRAQKVPRQATTRIAAQINSAVVTNKHRIINIKGVGTNVVADDTNNRSNIVIPSGYLYCVVDGGGNPIVPSSKPQTSIHVHDNLSVVQWSVVADQIGTIQFSLKSASYDNYPSTSNLVVGTLPNLTSQQKNKSIDYIDPLTGVVNVLWVPLGWNQLNIGDIIDVIVASAATVTRVTLILHCQAVS